MTTLTPKQLTEYLTNPLEADPWVRYFAKVPEDRYYTVSVWPDHLAGRVFVNMKDYRTVKSKKISKSDQS